MAAQQPPDNSDQKQASEPPARRETPPDAAQAWTETVRQPSEETLPAAPPTLPAATPAATAASFTPPERLGAIKLLRKLGEGAMGAVYLGHDELLRRNVAVKFLLDAVSGPDDPDFVRFLAGARAAAAVRHPGLNEIHHADVFQNVPYLIMEYVDGPTLADALRRHGPLSPAATLAVLRAVGEAVAELHRHGVIHRDLKPSNVLLDRAGRVCVTNFGLSFRQILHHLSIQNRSSTL